MGLKGDLENLSLRVSNLTEDDAAGKLQPLIRYLDILGTHDDITHKVEAHMRQARNHMCKRVDNNKITTKGLMNTIDNLMSAASKL